MAPPDYIIYGTIICAIVAVGFDKLANNFTDNLTTRYVMYFTAHAIVIFGGYNFVLIVTCAITILAKKAKAEAEAKKAEAEAKAKAEAEADTTCSICCFEKRSAYMVHNDGGGHGFCLDCANKWLYTHKKPGCPVCRAPVLGISECHGAEYCWNLAKDGPLTVTPHANADGYKKIEQDIRFKERFKEGIKEGIRGCVMACIIISLITRR